MLGEKTRIITERFKFYKVMTKEIQIIKQQAKNPQLEAKVVKLKQKQEVHLSNIKELIDQQKDYINIMNLTIEALQQELKCQKENNEKKRRRREVVFVGQSSLPNQGHKKCKYLIKFPNSPTQVSVEPSQCKLYLGFRF